MSRMYLSHGIAKESESFLTRMNNLLGGEQIFFRSIYKMICIYHGFSQRFFERNKLKEFFFFSEYRIRNNVHKIKELSTIKYI